MDVVLLKESIELGGKHLLPQPIELMHGPVQVDIMPGPIEIDDALPLIPTVAAGAGEAEEAASRPVGVDPASPFDWLLSRESEHELIQISLAPQQRKCSDACLDLILQSQVHTVGAPTATIDE